MFSTEGPGGSDLPRHIGLGECLSKDSWVASDPASCFTVSPSQQCHESTQQLERGCRHSWNSRCTTSRRPGGIRSTALIELTLPTTITISVTKSGTIMTGAEEGYPTDKVRLSTSWWGLPWYCSCLFQPPTLSPFLINYPWPLEHTQFSSACLRVDLPLIWMGGKKRNLQPSERLMRTEHAVGVIHGLLVRGDRVEGWKMGNLRWGFVYWMEWCFRILQFI